MMIKPSCGQVRQDGYFCVAGLFSVRYMAIIAGGTVHCLPNMEKSMVKHVENMAGIEVTF
jgi:hypothetical protein